LTGTGEKTVSGATTAAGTTFFNTQRPTQIDEGTCSNLGEARLYQVGFKDASSPLGARYEVHPGGGFPPTPIYVVVKVPDPADPTNSSKDKTVEGVIVGTNVRPPGATKFDARYRTYWYEIKDD
jgi:type IV pilus assembly protein PilY1